MQVRAHGVIMAHPPHGERASAERTLREWIKEHRVSVVAVGDGTASHETVEVVAAAVRADCLPHCMLIAFLTASHETVEVVAAAVRADCLPHCMLIASLTASHETVEVVAAAVRADPSLMSSDGL
jgi:hypothetical protein